MGRPKNATNAKTNRGVGRPCLYAKRMEKRVLLRVPDELYLKLKALAQHLQYPLAHIMRQAIEAGLPTFPEPPRVKRRGRKPKSNTA